MKILGLSNAWDAGAVLLFDGLSVEVAVPQCYLVRQGGAVRGELAVVKLDSVRDKLGL